MAFLVASIEYIFFIGWIVGENYFQGHGLKPDFSEGFAGGDIVAIGGGVAAA